MAIRTLAFIICCLILPSVGSGLRAQGPTAQNYVIGAQDVLAVLSHEDATLNGNYTVQADGTFTFPYIGSVRASGLTLKQFEDALKKRLKDAKFFVNPQLTVSIQQYRSQYVIVMGEVRSPGSFLLTGGMTLLQLIAQAGSMTPSSSGEVIIVRAKRPDAIGTDAEIIRADLSQLQTGPEDRSIALQDGDTVLVQTAERAFVVGEVKATGAYPVQRSTTVLQLLALAGGPTPDAAQNRIKIIRYENGKKVELKNVKLDVLVRPSDTVIVPTRFF